MKGLPELSVFAYPEAVAADVDQARVMEQPVDEGRGHDLVAEDLAPFLEAFI